MNIVDDYAINTFSYGNLYYVNFLPSRLKVKPFLLMPLNVLPAYETLFLILTIDMSFSLSFMIHLLFEIFHPGKLFNRYKILKNVISEEAG